MKRFITFMILVLASSLAFAQNDYIRHTVKWFEDINTISQKYNVPVEVIVYVNNLKSQELSTRQVLMIPTSKESWGDWQKPSVEEPLAPAEETAEAVPAGSCSLSLALNMTSGSEAMNAGSLDFYCGALLAARKLGEEGINVDMNVWDISKGVSRSQFKPGQVVIGPIKPDELQRVLDVVDSTTIVVSPLDHKADRFLESHANFVQAAPMAYAQYSEAVAWAREEKKLTDPYKPENFIILYWENEPASLNEAVNALGGAKYRKLSCEPSGDITSWEECYDPNACNIAIIAITNEAVLGNAMRNTRVFSKDNKMIVMAGSKAAGVSTENLHKNNTHCLCPYFVDYTDAATLEFIHAYRALFNSEPTQFAFQGYDLTYYFGKNKPGSCESQANLLQLTYKPVRKGANKGISNEGVRRVLYDSNYRTLLSK